MRHARHQPWSRQSVFKYRTLRSFDVLVYYTHVRDTVSTTCFTYFATKGTGHLMVVVLFDCGHSVSVLGTHSVHNFKAICRGRFVPYITDYFLCLFSFFIDVLDELSRKLAANHGRNGPERNHQGISE
jgi:hypothetical protein